LVHRSETAPALALTIDDVAVTVAAAVVVAAMAVMTPIATAVTSETTNAGTMIVVARIAVARIAVARIAVARIEVARIAVARIAVVRIEVARIAVVRIAAMTAAIETNADMKTAATLETPIVEDTIAVNVMITMAESVMQGVRTVIVMDNNEVPAATIVIDTTARLTVHLGSENQLLEPLATENQLPDLRLVMLMELIHPLDEARVVDFPDRTCPQSTHLNSIISV